MCACACACDTKLNEELLQMLNVDESINGFSVMSAPVILYLNSPHCDISNNELAISDDKRLRRVRAFFTICPLHCLR